MNIITGYKGTPHITAAQDGDINAGLVGGNLVLNVGTQFTPTVLSNTQIQIADGALIMQGRAACIEAGGTEVLTVQNPVQGESRIDLIVARYTKDGTGVESIELAVLTGTENTPPSYTSGSIRDGDLTVEVPLYKIINDLGAGGDMNVYSISASEAASWGMDEYFTFAGTELTLMGLKALHDLNADNYDALSEKVGGFKCVAATIASGSSVGVTFSSNVSALLMVNSQATALRGLYLVSRTTAALTHTAVQAGSSIAITNDGSSNNHCGIFNNGTAAMRIAYLVSVGTVSIDGQ